MLESAEIEVDPLLRYERARKCHQEEDANLQEQAYETGPDQRKRRVLFGISREGQAKCVGGLYTEKPGCLYKNKNKQTDAEEEHQHPDQTSHNVAPATGPHHTASLTFGRS